jgi:spermidine synthase
MNRISRYFPLLLILFAGSGCSALIYEIVWYQLLQLAIGSTAVSLGFLLATFMGGLCIGSVWLPRWKPGRRHPARMFAMLELGIAILAILVRFGIPLIDSVYFVGVEHGMPNMLLRAFISAICLLPPTILMGASLPAMVRWIEVRSTEVLPNDGGQLGESAWATLYGANTAGAVFGCLFAGFYLLRNYNTTVATLAAAAINLAVAGITFLLARNVSAEAAAPFTERAPSRSDVSEADASQPVVSEAVVSQPAVSQPAVSQPVVSQWDVIRQDGNLPIYIAVALSGACALGGEVVWTRLMGMLLGNTVYVFSIILAVFLIGLATGSIGASWILRSRPGVMHARAALGWSQVLLTIAIAWTAFMIADSLPYLPVNPFLSTSPWFTFQFDLARCIWAVLPPAILWGASFPLGCAAIVWPRQNSKGDSKEDPGALVGGVYAANTLGAIVGALGVSLALIPWIGTRDSQRVLLAVSAVAGLIVLIPYLRRHWSTQAAAWLTASTAVAVFLMVNVDAVPGELIAYGRQMEINQGKSTILYTAEGRNSSVAISRWQNGAIYVNVNGHVEATTEIYDMKLQRMVGHLPGLIHPNPKSVLGIGFGAGVSAGTFTRYPGIEHITICEIEPVIPPTSTRFFGVQDYEVMNNPRTHIIYDDARHYLLTTLDKFDIIASDPLDVFVKGTAGLYSKEYFERVKSRLNPGGFFTLYVPLYESDVRTVKSELATFFDVFPNGTVWANTIDGQGYDMVFMGQVEPLRINLDELNQRIHRPDYAPVAQSLHDIEIGSLEALFSTYAGNQSDLEPWLRGADINRDGDLRLQYIAGWSINSRMENEIYKQMMRYRRPPDRMFTGSPENVRYMLDTMAGGIK